MSQSTISLPPNHCSEVAHVQWGDLFLNCTNEGVRERTSAFPPADLGGTHQGVATGHRTSIRLADSLPFPGCAGIPTPFSLFRNLREAVQNRSKGRLDPIEADPMEAKPCFVSRRLRSPPALRGGAVVTEGQLPRYQMRGANTRTRGR